MEFLKTFAKHDWMTQVKFSPPRIKRKMFSLKERTNKKKYENELPGHEKKKSEWYFEFFFTPLLLPPITFYIHSREIFWLEQNGFQ